MYSSRRELTIEGQKDKNEKLTIFDKESYLFFKWTIGKIQRVIKLNKEEAKNLVKIYEDLEECKSQYKYKAVTQQIGIILHYYQRYLYLKPEGNIQAIIPIPQNTDVFIKTLQEMSRK